MNRVPPAAPKFVALAARPLRTFVLTHAQPPDAEKTA